MWAKICFAPKLDALAKESGGRREQKERSRTLLQEEHGAKPTSSTSQARTVSACITRHSACLQEKYNKIMIKELFLPVKFKANKPLSLFLHAFLKKSVPERYFPYQHIVTIRCFVL